jgi:5-methylcytosine-specific restriction endonuclease McrA
MTREERQAYGRDYYLRNRERIVAKRALRADAIKAYRADYWRKYSARYAELRAGRTPEQVEAGRLQRREWARKHRPDNVRRARKAMTAVGKVDYGDIMRRWDGKCHICRCAVMVGEPTHFDHIVPLAAGGAHVTENIWPAHARCNLRKQARVMD